MLIELGAVVAITGAALSGAPPTADEITSVYRQKYSQITTIRYESIARITPRVEPEVVFREFRILPPADVRTTVIYHRDGRLYHSERNPWSTAFDTLIKKLPPDRSGSSDLEGLFQTPYSRVAEAAEGVLSTAPSPSPTIHVFDGKRLWQQETGAPLTVDGQSRQAFSVIDTKRLNSPFLSRTLLDGLLFGFDVPGLTADALERAENRFPDLWSKPGASVLPKEEPVEDVPCVVIDIPNAQRLWLDPAIGLAVRKRQWFLDGMVIYEFVARDFESPVDGLWLPKSATYTQYGDAGTAKGAFLGKPVHDKAVSVSAWTLNRQEDEALLSVDVPSGAIVVDQTLVGIDEKGREVTPHTAGKNVVPSVSYMNPADQEDLDRVVLEAQKEAGLHRPTLKDNASRAHYRHWLLWFNVGVVLAMVALVAHRARKARSSP